MRRTDRSGFTLIELLVVVGIVSALSTLVILTLNPAELLRRSRDASRIGSLKDLTTALNIFQSDRAGGSLGASSTIYISVPDPTALSAAGSECEGLGLPSLPSDWSYKCAGPDYYRNVDGTGWLPVNLKTISSGSPLGLLPVDPINTTSSGLFYAYVTDETKYELTTFIEGLKNVGRLGTDAGNDQTAYEVGSGSGTLRTPARGLRAYWPFSEGTGLIAYDVMNNPPLEANFGITDWTKPCKLDNCIGFDINIGTHGIVPDFYMPDMTSKSVALWVNWDGNTIGGYSGIVLLDDFNVGISSTGQLVSFNGTNLLSSGAGTIQPNTWYYVTYVYDASVTKEYLYVNGHLTAEQTHPSPPGTPGSPLNIAIGVYLGVASFGGVMDDLRIYNRPLSPLEVQIMASAFP